MINIKDFQEHKSVVVDSDSKNIRLGVLYDIDYSFDNQTKGDVSDRGIAIVLSDNPKCFSKQQSTWNLDIYFFKHKYFSKIKIINCFDLFQNHNIVDINNMITISLTTPSLESTKTYYEKTETIKLYNSSSIYFQTNKFKNSKQVNNILDFTKMLILAEDTLKSILEVLVKNDFVLGKEQ